MEKESRAETVLLVEDEEVIRGLAEEMLMENGYHVLPCADAQEALDQETAYRGKIHVLITDVNLGGTSGVELAEQIRGRRPDVGVLVMSGHAEETVKDLDSLGFETHYIQKPFTMDRLLAKLADVLGDDDLRSAA